MESLIASKVANLKGVDGAISASGNIITSSTRKTGKQKKSKSSATVASTDLTSGKGELAPIAASILMRILYAARYARFDLLRATNRLTSYVHFWDADCDKRLHRIMQYLQHSVNFRMFGWVGDSACDVGMHTYADSDFAGCPRTLRSTSGAQLQMEGRFTRFPLMARSIRQPCVSYSTPEAEICALNLAYRTMSLPALDIMDYLLPPNYKCIFHEDNTACIQVIVSGKNPTMRYLSRTHGINIVFLHENLGLKHDNNPHQIIYTDTKKMVADIHTKPFTNKARWDHALDLGNTSELEGIKRLVDLHRDEWGVSEVNPTMKASNSSAPDYVLEHNQGRWN